MNQAESTLLSYLIYNPNFYFLRANEITDDMFTQANNKSVFNAIKTLLNEGKNVSVITVSNKMDIPDAFFIVTEILKNVVFSDIEDIVTYLSDNSKDRAMEVALSNAMSKIADGGWHEACQFLTQKITEINERASLNFSPIKNDLEKLYGMVDNIRSSNKAIGISTGLAKFDKFSGGLQLSDLLVLAARTSMGKTSLALTIGRNIAVDSKIPVAIYSLEMSSNQITARLASGESSISSKKILTTRLEDYEYEGLKQSTKKIYNSNIFIANSSNRIQSILSSMMGYVVKEGVKVFIVDYLQLVTLGQKGVSREQEVGQMARIFKNFAKDNNVSVILLSQLKRSNDSNEPSLSDLRDSGQIEEAADVVMFIHRPEYYNILEFEDGESTKAKADVIIAKGRNIGVARFRISFIDTLTKFVDSPENQYNNGY